MRWAQGVLASTTLIAGLAMVARRRLFVVRIQGVSMEPTFRSGDAVLAVRSGSDRAVRANDVVVAKLPRQLQGPTGFLVKRVTGLGGDVVGNGGAIPVGEVFLQGDGVRSYDSRNFGPLPLTAIRGRVIARMSLPVRRFEDGPASEEYVEQG